MKNINFYLDNYVVESFTQPTKLAEEGLIQSLIDKVKEYVGAHIDSNDKVKSLINIIGPGVIFTTFRALGFGWLGLLVSLAMRIFNVDMAAIVSAIWDKLKGVLQEGKQIASSEVDNIVNSSVQEHTSPATEDDATKALENYKFSDLEHELRIVKLTMMEYQQGTIKQGAGFLDMFNSRKSKVMSILTRVLGWIFKVSLASAGLMVAGDVVNKIVGRPNAFDHTIEQGKPVPHSETQTSTTVSPVISATTQTKFKPNPSYKLENKNTAVPWTENISNDPNSISQMLVQFAKDVYLGLDNDNLIKNTAGFQAVLDRIVFFNRTTEHSPVVFIPPEFKSKKQIVDYFIDEVAEKS